MAVGKQSINRVSKVAEKQAVSEMNQQEVEMQEAEVVKMVKEAEKAEPKKVESKKTPAPRKKRQSPSPKNKEVVKEVDKKICKLGDSMPVYLL